MELAKIYQPDDVLPLTESTVRSWCNKDEARIMEIHEVLSLPAQTMRVRQSALGINVESALMRWVRELVGRGIPVTGMLLRGKALELATALGLEGESFNASAGWLNGFIKRQGLRSFVMHGMKTPNVEWCNARGED